MGKIATDPKVFLANLIASKLMPEAEARAYWDSWSKQGVTTPEAFADNLVAVGKLSRYQADALLRGNKTFQLNDYTLIDRIGVGRMAGVYKGKHKLGMQVAIKILPPTNAKVNNNLVRFLREANMALKLDHPRLVKTYHSGNANNLHYIAMELLEGETLDDRLARRKKLPLPEVMELAQQTLEALQYLAGLNVVHRDLNPGNLMLLSLPGQDPDKTKLALKVLDIGLGRELFTDAEAQQAPGLTASGDMLGTPNYTAPEQSRDSHAADVRSDMYSLGCILYECLAGRVPFTDKNLVQKLTRHATEMPAIPDYGTAPGALRFHSFLWKMLAKRPIDRFQTPAEALAALQIVMQPPAQSKVTALEPSVPSVELVPVPDPAASTASHEPARRSMTPLWIGIGIVVIALLAVLGLVVKLFVLKR